MPFASIKKCSAKVPSRIPALGGLSMQGGIFGAKSQTTPP
jgi:hypothetical protein